MEHYLKINEVSKLFDIPVSTLHYWENIGLFQIKRNKENRYREYSMTDTLNIWEIMLYRELDIPIQEAKEILDKDVDNLEQVYDANQKKLEEEIKKLKRKKEKIKEQKRVIGLLKELEQDQFRTSEPDFSICKVDWIQMDTIKESLAHPYNCIMYISDGEKRECTRGIALPPKEDEELLWEKKQGQNRYIEFLLKMNVEDSSDNNLSEIICKLREMDIQTGEVIARYLLVANEKGRRMEFYRAWIEIE
ncbi:MAG: MerR family transcriptional regulator [bacterium]|nr:MerR family transcriptional regulator [bacterium]